MLESKQGLTYDDCPNTFFGVRFILFGFDANKEHKVRTKLSEGGGIEAVSYGPDCNHVIVDKLAYDDPICIAARRDGKTLVTGLWVDHSYDLGVPVEPTSVMYMPMRDLNGILGAKSLVICLTGYQRQDREDIMTMVALMGANFSKPLVANKVTHLICYKFEGEKYELAKKMKKIKLVNHRWLEDCLKAWELLPEADYSKSGYELEMEAEAKDSEEETEDIASKVEMGQKDVCNLQNIHAENRSSHPSTVKQEFSRNSSGRSVSKDSENAGDTSKIESTPQRGIDLGKTSLSREADDKHLEMTNIISTSVPGKMSSKSISNTGGVTMISEKAGHVLTLATEMAKMSPNAGALKSSSKSYSRSPPRKSSLPLKTGSHSRSPSISSASKLVDSGGFIKSIEDLQDGTDLGVKSPSKGTLSHCDEGTSVSIQGKTTLSKGKSKSPMLNLESRRRSMGSSGSVTRKTEMLTSGSLLDGSCGLSGGTSTMGAAHHLGKRTACALQEVLNSYTTSEAREACNDPMLQCSIEGFKKRNLASSNGKDNSFLRTDNSTGEVQMHDGDPHSADPQVSRTNNVAREVCNGEMLQCSIEGMEKRNLVNSHGKDHSFLRNDNSTGEGQMHQGDPHSADLQVPRTYPEEESMDVQADVNFSKAGDSDSQLKPVRRKMLARKKLASRLSFSKTAKQKGSINLQKAVLQNDHILHSSGVVGMGETENKIVSGKVDMVPQAANKECPASSETHAADYKKQNEDDEEHNEDKYTDVEASHSGEGVTRSKCQADDEILQMEEVAKSMADNSSSEVERATELNFVKSTGDASEKKLTKGKKRSFSKSKMNNLKDSGDEVKAKTEEMNSILEQTVMLVGKTKTRPSKKIKSSDATEKENKPAMIKQQTVSTGTKMASQPLKSPSKGELKADKANADSLKGVKNMKVTSEPAWFILSGHRLQRKEFQKIIKCLKGRVCRDSHQWSYQATHFIVPDPIRRTEKFFAAAASGSWILKTDYLTASNEAGRLLSEEPYEWHKKGLSEDGAINLEAPRKWRLQKVRTGCGAFHGLRIVIYGECIAPPLDTLKRVVKAGDGTILATSPPYTRFLKSGVDFAIVSPGMPHVDIWVQEFLSHEVPCVVADYLVDYVCKPGYSLEKHVQYNTHTWAEKSLKNLVSRVEEEDAEDPQSIDDIACQVCGSHDREEEMLICGDENGTNGCGVGMHINCLNPPLDNVPDDDWFCPLCSQKKEKDSEGMQQRSQIRGSKSKKR